MPLKDRGMVKAKPRVYKFVASFNVRAEIHTRLHPDIIESVRGCKFDGIFCDIGTELLCDKAIINSRDDKYSPHVSMGSATHQTNCWSFSKQTNVLIEVPHAELTRPSEKLPSSSQQRSLPPKAAEE